MGITKPPFCMKNLTQSFYILCFMKFSITKIIFQIIQQISGCYLTVAVNCIDHADTMFLFLKTQPIIHNLRWISNFNCHETYSLETCNKIYLTFLECFLLFD